MGGPTAGVASIAGLALSATSASMQGQANANAAEYKAETLDRAANIGKIQAQQVSGQMTAKLNNVLGNIDAARAAAHDDPTSPTGAAVRDYTEQLGSTQRGTTVDNIIEQSTQDASDAAYMRSAGAYAQTVGTLNAGSVLLKGLGGSNFSSFGTSGSSGGAS